MNNRTSNLKEDNKNKEIKTKTLPNSFEDSGRDFWKYFLLSAVLHPLAAIILWGGFWVLILLGIHNPLANRPEWKTKDIEFVLTMNEADPINKNTKYRSDRNSRAGGKHDPTRKVSMPSPAPSSAPAPAKMQQAPKAPPAPKQQIKKQTPVKQPKVQQAPKKQTTSAPKPKVAQAPVPKAPSKPSVPNAPVQRPVLKPAPVTPKPQMPKLAKAPSSPFKIDVPKTMAPVGKGFSTSTGASNSGGGGGGAQGTSTAKTAGSGMVGMPAPQFSTSRGTSSRGSSSGSPGSNGRGTYGTGNMGNPGPGNPSGAPGIDAIRSPQWGPYMRELESKIKRNWHPPKGDTSKRVVLLFKVGKRGELLSVKVAKTSGSQSNDQAAISAVQMSAPFRALPPEFTGTSVEIEFTFDYNVLGASYR